MLGLFIYLIFFPTNLTFCNADLTTHYFQNKFTDKKLLEIVVLGTSEHVGLKFPTNTVDSYQSILRVVI